LFNEEDDVATLDFLRILPFVDQNKAPNRQRRRQRKGIKINHATKILLNSWYYFYIKTRFVN